MKSFSFQRLAWQAASALRKRGSRPNKTQHSVVEHLEPRTLLSSAVPAGDVKVGYITLDATNGAQTQITAVGGGTLTFNAQSSYYFEAGGTFQMGPPQLADATYHQTGADSHWVAASGGGLIAIVGVTNAWTGGNAAGGDHIWHEEASGLSGIAKARMTGTTLQNNAGSIHIDVYGPASTIAISGDSTVHVGNTYTLGLSSSGYNPSSVSSWTINWGDGSSAQTISGNPSSATHAFTIGSVTRTISALATTTYGNVNAGNTVAVSVTSGADYGSGGPNPGFEGPHIGATSVANPSNAGWSFTGVSGIAGNGSSYLGSASAYGGTQVGYMAMPPSGPMPSIQETLTLPQSGTFNISAENRELISHGASSGVNVVVYVDGSQKGIIGFEPGEANWAQWHTSNFSLGAGTHTVTLTLSSYFATVGTAMLLDDVTLNFVAQGPVPATPTLGVSNASGNEIDLNWTPTGDSHTSSFTLQRAIINTDGTVSGWVTIARNLSSSTGTYADSATTANTGYEYQVTAYGPGGSASSNIVNATAVNAAPQASVLVHALPVSSTELYVAWARVLAAGSAVQDNSVNYYEILKSDNGSAYTHAGYAEPNATGAEIEGLTPGDTYSFEVVAHNALGTSAATASLEQVKTPLADDPGYYAISLTGIAGTTPGELTYSADGTTMHVTEPPEGFTYNGLQFIQGGYTYDISLAGNTMVWANSPADALLKGFKFNIPIYPSQEPINGISPIAIIAGGNPIFNFLAPYSSFSVPTNLGIFQHLDVQFNPAPDAENSAAVANAEQQSNSVADAATNAPTPGCTQNGGEANDTDDDPDEGGDPVQYFDGSWVYNSADLSSSAFGSNFSYAREWKSVNGTPSSSVSTGNGWTTSIPYLIEEGDTKILHRVGVVVDGKIDWFDQGTGAFFAEGGGTETLQAGGPGYIFTDNSGNQTAFYGFNINDAFRDIVGATPASGIPFSQTGQFASYTNAAGLQTASAVYDGDGNLISITRENSSVSAGGYETWTFSYIGGTGVNAAKLAHVSLARAVSGSSTASVVQSCDYAYYDGSQAYGNAGDLMTATVNDRSGNAVSTNYYRYYTPADIASGASGYVGGLRYVFNDASFAAMAAALGNPLTAANSAVAAYAVQQLQYDPFARVTQLITQGMGGKTPSSGGAPAGGTYSYAYSSNAYRVPTAPYFNTNWTTGVNIMPGFPAENPNLNAWAFKTIETLPDGSQNWVYTNASGRTMLSVYRDAATGLQEGTFYEYNSNGQQILMAEPSAVNLPASLATLEQYLDLLHSVNGAYQYIGNATGLLYGTVYASTTTATSTQAGDVKNKIRYVYLEHGQGGYGSETESFQYLQHTTSGVTIDPLASETAYGIDPIVAGSGGGVVPAIAFNTDPRTTTYAYAWQNSQPTLVTITLPVATSSENGSGVAEQMRIAYDSLGRPTWTKDANGTIDYTAYDDTTGAVVKQIVDVDTSNTSDFDGSTLPSGWMTMAGAGLNLVTTYEVDDQGRTTKEVDPTGNVTYTVYKDAYDPATGFVNEVRTYAGWHVDPATGLYTSTGPVQVTRYNEANQYRESLSYAAPELSSSRPDGSDSITSVQTLERDFYNSAANQLAAVDRYFNLSGVSYSASPRLGSSGANYYETQYGYDRNGNLSELVNPTGTIAQNVYDGQGRMTSTWVGTNDATSNGNVFDGTNAGSGNNMVKTASYVYDNGGSGDGNLMEMIEYPGNGQAARATLMYYDSRDRLNAEKDGAAVNSNGSVNLAAESDGTHRPIIVYAHNDLDQLTSVLTYDGDGVAISQNSASLATFTAQLTGETNYAYDHLGQLYQKQTYSVDPSTGSVSSTALTAQAFYDGDGNVIASESPSGLWTKDVYDGAERVTDEYSTDGAGGSSFASAGSVAGDHVLSQTHYVYDGDGNVVEQIQSDRLLADADSATGVLGGSGPGARVSTTANYFDAADRLTASVDLGTNGSSFTYGATPPARSDAALVTSYDYNDAGWLGTVTDPRNLQTRYFYDAAGRTTKEVSDYTDGTPTSSSNQTTQYTYDGDDNVTSMTAVMPTGTPSQTTSYVYGSTTARGDGVNSNDVLIATQYPDPSAGNASSGQQETYTNDALGETKTFTDRNGTTHQYAYDSLGRETDDHVTSFGTGVDQAVAQLGYTYNAQGLLATATSYDGSHAIVDQVQNVYNGLGQLSVQYQSTSGSVNTSSTPSVQYAYSDPSTGSRLTSMTYPNGRVISYNYGSAGSLDATIGRLSSLSDITGTLQSYGYQGLSTVLQETDGNGLQLNVTQDAFGRTAEQNWSNGSMTVDDTTYTYDRDGNVLTQGNGLNSSLSDTYTYDNLNRLTDDTRGGNDHQSWNLDALGNSNSVTTDGTSQSRTNNAQNQLTNIGGTSLTFDANGNETTDETGKTLLYDAWNHLVEAKSGSTSLIRYQYDAIGHRDKEGSTSVYFTANWQAIEDRNASGQVTAQYIYSPVYIDAMIERDRDTNGDGTTDERLYVLQNANFDVTAVATTSGTIAERFEYDPYGARTVLSPSWGSTTDAYSFMQGHQGGKIDAVTGYVNFRNRELNTRQMRWMSEDPKRYVDSDNFFLAVQNKPTTSLDPFGLNVWDNIKDKEVAGNGDVPIGGGGEFGRWDGGGPRVYSADVPDWLDSLEADAQSELNQARQNQDVRAGANAYKALDKINHMRENHANATGSPTGKPDPNTGGNTGGENPPDPSDPSSGDSSGADSAASEAATEAEEGGTTLNMNSVVAVLPFISEGIHLACLVIKAMKNKPLSRLPSVTETQTHGYLHPSNPAPIVAPGVPNADFYPDTPRRNYVMG